MKCVNNCKLLDKLFGLGGLQMITFQQLLFVGDLNQGQL